jgi:PAS domain-containing protein
MMFRRWPYIFHQVKTKSVYINPAFVQMFDITLEEVPSASEWWPRAYPDEAYRTPDYSEWQKRVEEPCRQNRKWSRMKQKSRVKDVQKSISMNFVTSVRKLVLTGSDRTEKDVKCFEDSEEIFPHDIRKQFRRNCYIEPDATISKVNTRIIN